MRRVRAKLLARKAEDARWVDSRSALVRRQNDNGSTTLWYRQGSARRIYQDLKKGV